MNRNLDLHDKYVEENELVFSLSRVYEKDNHRPQLKAFHIRRILLARIKDFIRMSYSFPKEVLFNFKNYVNLFHKKKCKKGKCVLIIGNGPSSSVLKSEWLDKFTSFGHDTICVNYWNENKNLSNHKPTYITLTDGVTFQTNAKGDYSFYNDKNKNLHKFIVNNKTQLIIPFYAVRYAKKLFPESMLVPFIDSQLIELSGNISPLFPRGYKSLTLYKALAMACHFEYEKIYVIGMDNTYPRNIYNDPDNHVCLVEQHAMIDDYLVDFSKEREGVAEVLEDIMQNFIDLRLFSKRHKDRIVNLDKYSLTDAFKKSKLHVKEVLLSKNSPF